MSSVFKSAAELTTAVGSNVALINRASGHYEHNTVAFAEFVPPSQ